MQSDAHHDQSEVIIRASQAESFDYFDDQTRLAAHIEKRSMRMLGGRMSYQFDAAKGRAVGSMIRMGWRFLGLSLFVREVVTDRTPPTRKLWQTRGPQRMLITNSYVMGFETRRNGAEAGVRVFIEYQLPHGLPARWLGLLFAPFYARWCVSRMAKDARRHFGSVADPGAAA